MIIRNEWAQRLYALIVGAAASIGVLFPAYGAVSLIGFVAFILLIHTVPSSRRSVSIVTILFGFAYCGTVHIWLWDLLPLDWLGVTNPLYGYLLLLFYWSTIAFSFGTVFLFFTFPYLRYKPAPPLLAALYAASLWTIVQYLQMWGTSLVTAGDGSLFGAHYSTVLLGYAVTDIPAALFLAQYGGVFAMTFVFVFTAALLAGMWEHWMRTRLIKKDLAIAIVLLVIIGTGSFSKLKPVPFGETVSVALVSTDFNKKSDYTWQSVAEKVHSLIQGKLNTAPRGTVFVLPEEINLFGPEPNDSLLQDLDESGHSVLFSHPVQSGEKKRLRMSLYHHGTSTGFYDKMLLSPQGEYGPWFYQVWLGIIGGAELVEASRSNYTYERGEHTAVAHIPNATIGALFCSDILSPQLYRILALQGATILTESTSLGWFHSSPVVDSVMLTIARVRAAENNRYLLVAGNAAPSTIISNTGSIIERTDTNTFSVLQANVPVITEISLYTKLGNLVLIPMLIFSLSIMLYQTRRSPKS